MGKKNLTVLIDGLARLPAPARRPVLLRRACRAALPGRTGELTLRFLGRAEMLKLNREFLGHEYDTDVIAFPDEPVPGVPSSEIGAVCVSAFLVPKQAADQGHSVLKETLTLALHGCLHLAGYDDSTPGKKTRMFKRQDALLARIAGR